MDLKKEDIQEIAEGMKLIEEGVERIQGVMRARKFKSIKEVAEQLLPIFQSDDNALTDSIIKHLG